MPVSKVNGWTVVTPSADSRIVYIASVESGGNDASAAAVYGRGYYLPNDPEIGADPTQPVGAVVAYRNPQEALKKIRGGNHNTLANGKPEWVLFRRGDSFPNSIMDGNYTYWGGGGPSFGTGGIWTWAWTGSQFSYQAGTYYGRSVTEPFVISAWGPVSEPRPVFPSGFGARFSMRNSVISSLDIQGRAGLQIGVQTSAELRPWENMLIEDCRIQGHGGLSVQGGSSTTNLTLRRCVIADGWNSGGHNQGMFVSLVEDARLTFEECVFDRNGFKENPNAPQTWTAAHTSSLGPGALPVGTGVQPTRTYFDRNWYLSGKNGRNLRVRGNIASRTAGGGEQFRSGGVAERNLFLFDHDGIMATGLGIDSDSGYGSAPMIAKGNVHLHDDAMLPPGGYGMNNEVRAWGGALWIDNIYAHAHHYGQNGGGTLHILGNTTEGQYGSTPPPDGWRAVVQGNIVRSSGTLKGWGIEAGAFANNAAEVRNNTVAIDNPPSWLGASPTASPRASDTIDGNLYFGNPAASRFSRSYAGAPRYVAANTTFAQWQSAGYDPNGQMIEDWSAFKTAAGWTDPDRDIVSYMQSIDPAYVADEDVRVDFGCSGSLQTTPQLVRNVVPGTDAQKRQVARRFHAFVTFINRARENRKGAWDTEYTAEGVINYIRQGFGKSPITGDYDTRDISLMAADYFSQHGPVDSLVLTTQPVGDISGQLLAVQPVVTLRDASNLTVSSDNATQVSVAIQSGSNGTLTGTTTVTVVNGVATFTNLVLTGTDGEPYVLRFSITSPALNVDSVNVVVTDEILPPTTVKVTREPQAGLSGTIFTTQPKIVLEDNLGSIVSSDSTTSVTAAITGGLGGTLTGTTTVIAVNGIVEFTDLVLTGDPNQQYTISFTSSGLISDSSTVTLQSVVSPPPPPAPTTDISTDLIRTGKYFGEVHSLNIDGEFNKSDLLSLRLNQTRMIGVGTQDFIVKYRNTILKTKNIDFSIPEDWDLFWSFKQGPITNPNQIAPCFLWLKPENFNISDDGTKYTSLDNAGKLSDFSDNFSAEIGNEASRSYAGLNSFIPLSFNGTSSVYVHEQESGDFAIPNHIDFSLAFVVSTNSINTNKSNAVFSIGKDGETGSLQTFVEETGGARKISVSSYVGKTATATSTTNNCYNQGDSIIVLISRVNNQLSIRVNGTPQSLTGSSKLPDIIAISTGSYIGAVSDSVTDTFEKFLNHDIYEVLLVKEVIDYPITLNNLEELEGYLAAKYKLESLLPSNHAYKNEPPRTAIIQDELITIISNPLPSITCDTLSATASSVSPPSNETTETITVTVADSNCQWEASTTADWITLTNPFNIGNGSFSYTVDENTGEERVGTITVISGTALPVVLTIAQAAGIITNIVATGGTETDSSGYRYHTFTSNGTFEVSTGGTVEVLLVGGGGGGREEINAGGGGGGGGVRVLDGVNALNVEAGSYTITVGSGGAQSTTYTSAYNGGSSSIIGGSISETVLGGGKGGGRPEGSNLLPGSLATGGGAGTYNTNETGGTGTAGQGYDGGDSYHGYDWTTAAAGGGGGAGSAGGDAANAVGGNGGDGVEVWGTTYGGGGGGAVRSSTGTIGLGGSGGGGNGGKAGAGTAGAANTGGGGGGGGNNSTGGAGGSGIVIVRYAI